MYAPAAAACRCRCLTDQRPNTNQTKPPFPSPPNTTHIYNRRSAAPPRSSPTPTAPPLCARDPGATATHACCAPSSSTTTWCVIRVDVCMGGWIYICVCAYNRTATHDRPTDQTHPPTPNTTTPNAHNRSPTSATRPARGSPGCRSTQTGSWSTRPWSSRATSASPSWTRPSPTSTTA